MRRYYPTLFLLLVSCSSEYITVTDPVTGTVEEVHEDDFWLGVSYITQELGPMLRSYYKNNGFTPKSLQDFQSVAEPKDRKVFLERYCEISTRELDKYAYISVTIRYPHSVSDKTIGEGRSGCTNPIFWNVALKEDEPMPILNLNSEDMNSLLKEMMNRHYPSGIPIPEIKF